MKMAKSKNISEEINFQSYVDEVKHGNIHWKLFVNFMKDLSYSDIDRLRQLNTILVTELTMNFSDIEKLRDLNMILLAEFKNFIQKKNNFEIGDYNKSNIENSQFVIDHDLNDEIIEETIINNEIQVSKFEENEEIENLDAFDEGENSEFDQSIPNTKYLNSKIEETQRDCEIQASLIKDIKGKDNLESDSSNVNNSLRKSNVPIFHCNICSKQYGMNFYLKQHIKNVHKKLKMNDIDVSTIHEDVKPANLKCEPCSKSFSTAGTLKKHIYTIHEGQKDLKCELCGKLFSHAGNFKRHIRTVHERHKDYKCEYCGKSFSELGNLKRHINIIHEANGDHKCESCGKSFFQPSNLRKHVYTVHEGHKDYKCDSCYKSFTDSRNLKRHIHTIHEGCKNYNHDSCDKSFSEAGK